MKIANLPISMRDGKTPEAWCGLLRDMHGMVVSPRAIRSAARKSGNFVSFGGKILLLPHHIDNISEVMAGDANQTSTSTTRSV
ncbi:hypothetical protein [Shimia sp. MMG029]|uniref:hypothetical protein n=1 Tax=Shimia sp. MMG029 TaxID=3021978 RepID=UPI0022FDC39C|nr:hypothetical protein [Shimia sp. MMG029]MDA5558685.1 hypothetical protein [Shimia sp. MMG029]